MPSLLLLLLVIMNPRPRCMLFLRAAEEPARCASRLSLSFRLTARYNEC